MIPVQSIVDEMASALDAEGSDYYTFDRDYKPAINRSVRWLVSVINKGLGHKKFKEEQFRDLEQYKVFATNAFSRISLAESVLGHQVWTVLAVKPLPETYPSTKVVVPVEPYTSQLKDVAYLSSRYSATRLTTEEWEINSKNPFKPGYEGDAICDELHEYSYKSMSNYTATGYPVEEEIEMRPKLEYELCAVHYLKSPDEVALIGDDIEFPESLFNLITEKALNFISYKQGDGTNIFSASDRDVNILMSALS